MALLTPPPVLIRFRSVMRVAANVARAELRSGLQRSAELTSDSCAIVGGVADSV